MVIYIYKYGYSSNTLGLDPDDIKNANHHKFINSTNDKSCPVIILSYIKQRESPAEQEQSEKKRVAEILEHKKLAEKPPFDCYCPRCGKKYNSQYVSKGSLWGAEPICPYCTQKTGQKIDLISLPRE